MLCWLKHACWGWHDPCDVKSEKSYRESPLCSRFWKLFGVVLDRRLKCNDSVKSTSQTPHQKIVLKQRVIFTIPKALCCSPFLSLSKTVTLSVRLEICWHGRSAQERKSTPGVLLVSVSFVCSCRDRFRLCYTNVSVQWDAFCTVISWAWWCCWWSRHQKKGS